MRKKSTKLNRLLNCQPICILILTALCFGYSNHSFGQINYTYGWENVTDLGTWTSTSDFEDFDHTDEAPCTGTGSVSANIDDGSYSILTSGNLGTSNGGLITLTYKYKVTEFDDITIAAPAAPVNIEVQYASSATGPWTTIQTINSTNHVVSASCASQTVTFTPPSGNLYIRFNCVTTNGGDLLYYFDNISATQGAAPSCLSPAGVSVSNVTATTVNVSFTAPASAPANGYDYYISTASTAPASGTAISGNITTSPSTISNLSPVTTYYLWLRSNCAANDQSAWTNAGTFTTTVSCPAPTALLASNVTTTSATINYTASSTTPANGYDYYSSAANTAPGAATAPTGNVSGTTVNITGDFNAAPQYVWVRSHCSNTDQSTWTGPVYLGYCKPSANNMGPEITSFSTSGGTSNINNNNSGFTPGGYQNATNMVVSQYQGNTVNLSAAFMANPRSAVWVDWNNDLIFDNSTEKVLQTTSATNTITGSFTVPATAIPGNHRMRILAQGSSVNPSSACSINNNLGEAEDYTLNVIQLATCTGAPASVSISPATANACASYTGTLTVDPSPSATGYTYQWQSTAAGAGTWADIAGATNASYNVNGITASTDYRCMVACSGNSTISEVRTVTIVVTPPSNDDYCNAITLQLNGAADCRNTTCATTSAEDPNFGSAIYAANNTAWYKYTPATTGSIYFKFKRPDGVTTGLFNGAMGIYTATGNCPGTLNFTYVYGGPQCNLSSSDNIVAQSPILTANTTYYFMVGNLSSDMPGAYCLQLLSQPPLPPNDEAPGAVSLTLGAGCTGNPYTNSYATQSTAEPFPDCVGTQGYAGMWYKFIAPASGAVRVSCDGFGTFTDSRMALFSATDVNDYSTFQILACDDNNGVANAVRSLFYATGLTAGQTYYIEVDQLVSNTTKGTYCVTVDEMSSSMLATTAANCVDGQGSVNNYNTGYHGWISLVDADGKLNANVRQLTGAGTDFSSSTTIKTGTLRSDANGLNYMNRNFLIEGEDATSADMQLFFTNAELTEMGGNLNSLNVTRVSGTTCSADFVPGSQSVTLLTQTASGSVNGVHYIQVNTPGFSNFYIMNGNTPLPLELISFTGRNENEGNILNWQTANENSISHFELKRSVDGVKFKTLANLPAKGKNISKYRYEDNQAAKGTSYYRLTLQRKDGKTELSDIIAVNKGADKSSLYNIYPNPATHVLIIELKADAPYSIYDLQGKAVMKGNLQTGKTILDISLLARGFYTIKIGGYNQKIVLQ